MLTKQEKFDLALGVIQRIAPGMLDRYRRENHAPLEASDVFPDALVNSRGIAKPSGNLMQILKQIGPLPPYSALIGKCTDGLPFLLDLSDPTPGAILISGSAMAGKTAILSTILTSAVALNMPSEVNFSLLSPNCGEFAALGGTSHCRGMISTYDRASTEEVIRLAEIAEQRKSGRNRGAVIILAIDNLETMLQYHEHELKAYLRWLARYGPQMGIWPIVTIDPAKVSHKDADLISEFATQISDGSSPRQLHPGEQPGRLSQTVPGQFSASVGGELFSFSPLNAV